MTVQGSEFRAPDSKFSVEAQRNPDFFWCPGFRGFYPYILLQIGLASLCDFSIWSPYSGINLIFLKPYFQN